MIMLSVASAVMADNSQAQGTVLAPMIADVGACTVIVTPGQSIQQAVTKATNGTVICVRAGVYNEQVKLKGKNAGVTLMGYLDNQEQHAAAALRRRAQCHRREL